MPSDILFRNIYVIKINFVIQNSKKLKKKNSKNIFFSKYYVVL